MQDHGEFLFEIIAQKILNNLDKNLETIEKLIFLINQQQEKIDKLENEIKKLSNLVFKLLSDKYSSTIISPEKIDEKC